MGSNTQNQFLIEESFFESPIQPFFTPKHVKAEPGTYSAPVHTFPGLRNKNLNFSQDIIKILSRIKILRRW